MKMPSYQYRNSHDKDKMVLWPYCLDSSSPGQNGRNFPDDIFKCIFVNEEFCILIQISRKFVPKGIGSGNGLVSNRRQAITWTNADPVLRRIYTSLGGDELMEISVHVSGLYIKMDPWCLGDCKIGLMAKRDITPVHSAMELHTCCIKPWI